MIKICYFSIFFIFPSLIFSLSFHHCKNYTISSSIFLISFPSLNPLSFTPPSFFPLLLYFISLPFPSLTSLSFLPYPPSPSLFFILFIFFSLSFLLTLASLYFNPSFSFVPLFHLFFSQCIPSTPSLFPFTPLSFLFFLVFPYSPSILSCSLNFSLSMLSCLRISPHRRTHGHSARWTLSKPE